MDEKNNQDWFEDEIHEEVENANKRLMRDCCLLVKGLSNGALVAAIYHIKPVHMLKCTPFSIGNYWLK